MNNHIPLLDAYRFLAALSVACFHYFGDAHSWHTRYNIKYGKIFEFPSLEFFSYGRFGVDLFFLISGFVIALSAEGRSFSKFFASRVARIVPTYWLAIVITSLIVVASSYESISIRQIIANVIFLQKPMQENFIDGVYWSIVIEFRFYLLVAILIIFNIYKHYHWILLIWSALCLSDAFGVNLGYCKQIFITSYGYYFAGGGALYHLYRQKHTILALITLTLSFITAIYFSLQRHSELTPETIIAITLTIYTLVALISTRQFDNITWKILPTLGAITYPFYLLHLKVGNVIMRNNSLTDNGLMINLSTIALMIFISWLINIYFENTVNTKLRVAIEKSLIKLATFFKQPIAY
ncbi:acyltransferase family protein [Methylomonas sp. CM2]|uniref:acyltransferase family protein n=1 Tax=Methylomonas sp. CM2 TaxID=3417647 RepID=UPI003CF187A3